MTLNEILTPFLPDPQNEAAMDWLARWEKRGGKSLTPAYVETCLSKLLNEREDGLRFFYNDPDREALLSEVLNLDPDTHNTARDSR